MRRGKTRTLVVMAKHSAFELEVLGFVFDDYEAPHTIVEDIARELKRLTSKAEVLAALLALARTGMVQSYVYDSSGSRYRAIAAQEAASAKDPWFMVTAEGKLHYERHAN
jgi:hypothetical protein